MSILGLDEATVTTDDLALARKFLQDYGLDEVESSERGFVFHALDGTGLRVRHTSDPELPAPYASGPNIRQAIWGVSDVQTLDAIAAELVRDRPVQREGGMVLSVDDDGLPIGFQLTQRKPLRTELSLVNVPGLPPQRPVNAVPDFNQRVRPLTFSHLVVFTPDMARTEAFYQRLGFRTTDRLTGSGVFMRAPGNQDHHQLFFVYRPQVAAKGLHHVAFHVKDHTEVMLAGMAFAAKGWQTLWGPGRHIFGANHFWYFNSPFGGKIEFDADMDVVDDNWLPREAAPGPRSASIWATSYVPVAK
jgi:catechol 2,3-dioxygenase-like lactoylglutathione lyase family enzyme